MLFCMEMPYFTNREKTELSESVVMFILSIHINSLIVIKKGQAYIVACPFYMLSVLVYI